jgi:hypothetical protein
MENENKLKLPTEVVELPSKGLLYAPENPLSSGTVEMKYMTAKEEDILSNQNYIRQGVVFDKLLRSLIVSKINFDDLLIGDKNAIMIAARILGYGKDYEVQVTHPQTGEPETVVVDLSLIKEKSFDTSSITPGVNEFSYKLPKSGNEVTFKLLTNKDEDVIEQELKGLKKANISSDVTTRLKQSIIAVNGDREKKAVRDFVDNYLLAADARALRAEMKRVAPDLDLTFTFTAADGYTQEGVDIPMGLGFFYPTTGV